MQAAEGVGPKPSKRTWPLGKFVTIYGNGDPATNTNPAPVAYPAAFGNGTVNSLTTSGAVASATIGSAVPGLNLNINGNGATDVSFVCAPDPMTSLQDMETVYARFWTQSTFSGSCLVILQGSNNRLYQNTNPAPTSASAWVTIVSGTLTSASGNTSYTLNNTAATAEAPRAAYRILVSGSAVGVIDWSIPGMFVDYYAMGIGANATDTNGGIGQIQIQNVRNLTLSGSSITVNQGADPFENIKANHTFLG